MIHLLCDCGSLVSVAPPAGARSLSCRSCGRVLEVPDPASVGHVPAASIAPAPAPFPRAAPEPAGAPPTQSAPVFQSDERLNLRDLEREAARQGTLGRVVLLGGFLGAAAAPLLHASFAARVAVAASVLFVAVAAWSGFRAARASCLAAVALAQRQMEMVRGMERA